MKNVAFLAFGATLKQLMLLTLAFIASNTAVKKGLVSSQMITVSCFNTVIQVFFQKCLKILLIMQANCSLQSELRMVLWDLLHLAASLPIVPSIVARV